MNQLFNLIKDAAPALATVVAGPMGGLAVKAIADKLGVANEVGAITAALTANPAAAQKLAEIDIEKLRMSHENTANARAMQMAALNQDDVFTKRFVMYFAIGWSVLSATYIGFITFGYIPTQNVRFADTILGFVLGTLVSTIINFFYGSAHGSTDKQETLKEVIHSQLEHK